MFEKFKQLLTKALLRALRDRKSMVGILPPFDGFCSSCGQSNVLIIPVFEFVPEAAAEPADLTTLEFDPEKREKYTPIKGWLCFECFLLSRWVSRLDNSFVSYLLLFLTPAERIKLLKARGHRGSFWWSFYWGYVMCSDCGEIHYPDFEGEDIVELFADIFSDWEEKHKCENLEKTKPV